MVGVVTVDPAAGVEAVGEVTPSTGRPAAIDQPRTARPIGLPSDSSTVSASNMCGPDARPE